MASVAFKVVVAALLAGGAGGYYYVQSGQKAAAAARAEAGKWKPHELAPGENERVYIDQQVKALTREKNFDELERLSISMRTNDERTSEGWAKLSSFYEGVDGALAEIEMQQGMKAVDDLLKEWQTAKPESLTVKVTRGSYKVSAAWRARGNGYANEVRPEQWKVFGEMLNEAYVALAEAETGPKGEIDPEAMAWMLALGKAAGMPRENADEIINRCIEKYPTYEHVYRAMAEYLLPRWLGEPGDLEAFADDVQKRLPAPLGDIMYARIFGLVMRYEENETFNKTRLSYAKVKAGYDAITKAYPDGNDNKMLYAKIATLGNDRETARRLYEETEKLWDAEVISGMWNDQATFESFKAWAQGDGSNPFVRSDLELALNNSKLDEVTSAVLAGADVNQMLMGGKRPIQWALEESKKDIASFLLEHGADLTLKDRDGVTVAASAAEGDNVDVVKALVKNGLKPDDFVNDDGWKLLHIAAWYGSNGVVEYLITEAGVPVDLPGGHGCTALFEAAKNNKVECAKLLVKHGANVKLADGVKDTALHYGAAGGAAEAVDYLLQQGADPTARNSSDVSVLETAERHHQAKAAALIKAAIEKK